MLTFAALALLAQAPETTRFKAPDFAIDVPAGWRRLTPDEEARLRPQLPRDMQRIVPRIQFVVGNVDRWLESGFDGHALLALVQDGGLTADEAGLRQIRGHWGRSEGAESRRLLDSSIVDLGRDDHPAIECDLITDRGGDADIRALEYYVPSGRKVLILSLRARSAEFERLEPTLRRAAASVTFARAARDPESLNERLLYAAIIGGLVGLALLGLSASRRRRQ